MNSKNISKTIKKGLINTDFILFSDLKIKANNEQIDFIIMELIKEREKRCKNAI